MRGLVRVNPFNSASPQSLQDFASRGLDVFPIKSWKKGVFLFSSSKAEQKMCDCVLGQRNTNPLSVLLFRKKIGSEGCRNTVCLCSGANPIRVVNNNSNNNNNNNFDLQIHNEEIHDLLNPCPSDESRIAIRDTHDGGIKVIKLKAIIIDNNNY